MTAAAAPDFAAYDVEALSRLRTSSWRITYPQMVFRWRVLTSLVVAAAAALWSCSKPTPGPAGPHFGKFCVQRKDWPNLIMLMKDMELRTLQGFTEKSLTRRPAPSSTIILRRGTATISEMILTCGSRAIRFDPVKWTLMGRSSTSPLRRNRWNSVAVSSRRLRA